MAWNLHSGNITAAGSLGLASSDGLSLGMRYGRPIPHTLDIEGVNQRGVFHVLVIDVILPAIEDIMIYLLLVLDTVPSTVDHHAPPTAKPPAV